MTKHKKPNTDAAPPIGEKLVTLREAAEVLRLSTRTIREYNLFSLLSQHHLLAVG